jgi:membrane AbrB-like protein
LSERPPSGRPSAAHARSRLAAPHSWLQRTHAARLLRTLAIGALGGSVFFTLQLPLAWMLGAMVFTTVGSLGGARLHLPQPMRGLFVVVIGVFLGSAFTPEVLDNVARWPLSLAGLVLYVGAVTAVLYLYFRRVQRFDRVTAYFSATPGGLSEMVIAGGAMGGDDRRIALVHAARVLMVVMIIPFGFRFVEGDAAITAGQGLALADAQFSEMWALVLAAVVGPFLGRLLRLPAYRMVGPMLASAAVHITGLTHSPPPWELVATAQVVIGCAVGSRFSGVPLEQVGATITASIGSTTLMLLTTVVFAWTVDATTALGLAPLVLAYSPGGLAEMSLIALALGTETAFVATHHVFRIGLIVITAPLLFRLLDRPRAGSPAQDRRRGGGPPGS